MEYSITITPGELYYLGRILQAKYIDYAYVAAMEDIRHNSAVYESGTRSALVEAGILSEDFSGNLEVENKVKELMTPVFFGEFESCIDITILGENPGINTKRFHSFNGAVTMVCSTLEGKLQISSVDEEKLRLTAEELLSSGYSCTETNAVEDIPQENVERIIAVKNAVIGKTAVVKLYVEADGIIYSENSSGAIESLTAKDFATSVLNIIREEA